MRSEKPMKKILKAIHNYVIFFLLTAFVVTCCTALFASVLAKSMSITFTDADIGTAAKLTFINVIAVSIIFTLIDSLRRKLTVERPVKKIAAATEKMIGGDFSVRISNGAGIAIDKNFSKIIGYINKMAEELSGTETLRTDFIANVSHEMKTPLSIMQNYGKLLQEPTLSDQKRIEYAKALTDSSRRLSDMITNILKLNRLENQNIYPNAQRYDLSDQLCESILQYESVWDKKGINIETDIEDGVNIVADSELFSLVWSNLLSNAFKFTDEGGTVSVSLSASERYATVKISDTGCGISQSTGQHIFEKFYQGDTSHSSEGNGLGLALVKRIIDITKSTMNVESEPGKGTSFTVIIKRNQNRSDGEQLHRNSIIQ